MDFYEEGKRDGSRGNAPRYPASDYYNAGYGAGAFTLNPADALVDCGEINPRLSPYELARQAEEAAAFTLQPTTNAPRTTTAQPLLF